MESKLNTTNPENLLYHYEALNFTVMGGIRLEGLHQLKSTLKVAHKQRSFRHSLDLYNDGQLDRYIRRGAQKLELGPSYLETAVNTLIDELENYRLQQLENLKLKSPKFKTLTAAEEQEAKAFLQSNDLLQKTNEAIGKSGVIGEELNRLIMYLVFTSRNMEKPLHVISFGSSGMGKSHLQESVAALFPEEDKLEITSLTGNAFYYFEADELGHKLILIEDLDGAEAALYPLRELQSKQRISKTITIKDNKGNTKTIHLKVNGPVSVAGCTTQETIYEDNANRSFLIYVDESEMQDERIMDFQRALSAGKINKEEQIKTRLCLKNCQRLLQPITVINPYAEYLKLPKEVFKPRRTNAHYIAFIEAITFYHQYQREQKTNETTGEIYIETTLEDIAQANTLMKEILLRKSDELTGGCRKYFEQLKNYLQEKKKNNFTNAEIKNDLRIPVSTVKRHHTALLQNGLIKRVEEKDTLAHHYEITNVEEYKQLQNRINTVLDEVVIQIKRVSAHQPTSAQNENELMKPKQRKPNSQ
jgi:predicted transcriptional regulator